MSEWSDAARPALVVTDREGGTVEVNAAAAELLNISVRSRPWFYKIALFFDGNRDAVLGALRDAGPEPSAPRVGVLRPKERAPRPTSFTVRELPDGLLAWALGTS